LQTETKKLYGDYLIEDFNNSKHSNYFRDSNFDNINLSTFFEDEFLILTQNKQHIIEFKSVSNESLDKFYELNLQDNLKFLFEDEIIIGKSLANRLNLDIGDNVQIISKDFKLSSLSLPEIYSFKVANIFSNRILKADNFLVFGVNKEIFRKNNVFVELNGNISELKNQSFSFLSWKDRNRQLFEATEIGNETYPPNPKIKSGFSFFKINIDFMIENNIVKKEKKFFIKFLLLGVFTFKVYDLNCE